MSTTKKWVYRFDQLDEVKVLPRVNNDWQQVKYLLGGKGSNLFEMTRLSLPVPPGFTITTEACNEFLTSGNGFPNGMWEQTLNGLRELEAKTGKKFGDVRNPLYVSVRSGAPESMPGMMETVLNIGLNNKTALALIAQTGNPRFVYDSYRRLVQMFGTVVMGIPDEPFEQIIASVKLERNVKLDVELNAEEWERITNHFKKVIKLQKGTEFPQDPYLQLEMAVRAVFESWHGKRATDYRKATGIPNNLGTAVNIQAVVFGNKGDTSATGVTFTRNPVNGNRELYGDYLINAQGEDVVAGIRNTSPIAELANTMPGAYAQLLEICTMLELHFRDMQDIEFTIEEGKLWMLQTRNGKRAARAAIAIAVKMVEEGLIDRKTAIKRITPAQVSMLLHPQFSDETKNAARMAGRLLVKKAVNASPGAAVGMAVFDADTAESWGKAGKAVIMVRPETKPDDVHGMIAAKGILTSRGGATSHAAVVARQFGTPAVCGAEVLQIDVEHKMMVVGSVEVREGEWLSIDGSTGEVFIGKLPMCEPDYDKEHDLQTLLGWADEVRRLGVWANADYPKDAELARRYGAEGVGLCRTEHMFFEADRLPIVQEMILAATKEVRQIALNKLLPKQRIDFEGLFQAMDSLPVIIRLIDPPLHEFMPSDAIAIRRLARRMKITTAKVKERIKELEEANPMLGLRGDRLGIMMPEIVEMQVRAILEAAVNVKHAGIEVYPEIMIPLVSHVNELRFMRELVGRVAKQVFEELGDTVGYKFGSMIEVPRAALTAGELAEVAEFFSYGTNDLTQMTFGISRDDAERSFLLRYVEDGILLVNPFQTIDQCGVGQLIHAAVAHGRATRPKMPMGICGEHGGDPKSIEFCHQAGLDYVSCSPFRVPIARLAAAQAALK